MLAAAPTRASLSRPSSASLASYRVGLKPRRLCLQLASASCRRTFLLLPARVRIPCPPVVAQPVHATHLRNGGQNGAVQAGGARRRWRGEDSTYYSIVSTTLCRDGEFKKKKKHLKKLPSVPFDFRPAPWVASIRVSRTSSVDGEKEKGRGRGFVAPSPSLPRGCCVGRTLCTQEANRLSPSDSMTRPSRTRIANRW